MHKQLWNALRLEVTFTPKAPLLIKSGILSPNPALPDMQFVRTLTTSGETVYLPGASLKGVFRHFTEKVLRTLNGERWACDPLGNNACGRKSVVDQSGKAIDEEDERYTPAVYAQSCYACKLYGNTRLRGRIAFTDAFPEGEVITETRYGVAISRLTNAVAHGPFEMEIAVSGAFKARILLENFEVWQLGLVALTMNALNEGLLKIGFGKNRGLGEVTCSVTSATLDLAKDIPPTELWGVGCFVSDEERKAYGLRPDDLLSGLPEPASTTNLGVFARRTYDADGWQAILKQALAHLPKALEVRS